MNEKELVKAIAGAMRAVYPWSIEDLPDTDAGVQEGFEEMARAALREMLTRA